MPGGRGFSADTSLGEVLQGETGGRSGFGGALLEALPGV